MYLCRLLTLLIMLRGTSFALAETVTIATGEYTPYTTSETKYEGFVNRVIREAFLRQNIDVDFVYLPWIRASEDTKKGRYDATSFWFEDKERKSNFYHSEPITEHRELLFHLKSTELPDWNTIEDLKDYSFSITRGYSYIPEFWEAIDQGTIQANITNSDIQNMKMMLVGRVQVFPVDEVTGWHLINKHLPLAREKITTHRKPFRTTLGFLLFPKSKQTSERLVTIFNKGLSELKSDGTFEKFYEDLFAGEY